ncbi:MAG: 4Fe-4S binding protein [Deltaproteobacteria bacterium]|nr:4Fe-4S binding protein [Deltaproteobacteria bacterium]MBW2016696.1 4Fe-4S binding protein [Deltaproteobacteria bacterium]MBW2128069.1 4Fe-4S binding protein [Deltaproteobacteria bacterium]MBW2304089.1 4Fe-4S binding protein [Deltaproteobacteria bacterium]
MGEISLMFFRKDCMGCHACEVACKQEHGLGVGPRLVRVIERAPVFTPIYCHHCAGAPCKEACPVEAIFRNGKGIVWIDPEVCIGCKACMEACPFGAMQFDDETETAVKCDLCQDRLEKNLGPACASVCPTGCIVWGDSKTLSEEAVARAMAL